MKNNEPRGLCTCGSSLYPCKSYVAVGEKRSSAEVLECNTCHKKYQVARGSIDPTDIVLEEVDFDFLKGVDSANGKV